MIPTHNGRANRSPVRFCIPLSFFTVSTAIQPPRSPPAMVLPPCEVSRTKKCPERKVEMIVGHCSANPRQSATQERDNRSSSDDNPSLRLLDDVSLSLTK